MRQAYSMESTTEQSMFRTNLVMERSKQRGIQSDYLSHSGVGASTASLRLRGFFAVFKL